MLEPDDKAHQIAEQLRGRILSGQWVSSQRVPDRAELGDEFHTSLSTIQRAMDQLREDGFLHARPRAGTFVADFPPHRSTVALVCRQDTVDSKYVTAIRQAAATAGATATAQGRALRIREYLTGDHVEHCQDTHRLVADGKARRIGAMMFIFPPVGLVAKALLANHDLPRISFSSNDFGAPEVVPNDESFRGTAMKYLLSRGRKRIAHLYVDDVHIRPQDMAHWLNRFGVPTPTYLIQPVGNSAGFRGAASIANLLMRLPVADRPDGLVVHDDNMVEHVVTGLLTSGINVPHDLDVVAHANFPNISPLALPVMRLGFDCTGMMKQGLQMIDDLWKGKSVSMSMTFPPVFEHELSR